MTEPLFYTEPGQLTDIQINSVLKLGAEESRHALKSMRLKVGEPVLLADGEGISVTGVVSGESEHSDRLHVAVSGIRSEPQPKPRLVLVQALAKGDRDLLAIQTATEVGIDDVVPWESERSIVRLRADRIDRQQQKWADALRSAAKQARRARIPALRQPVTGKAVSSLLTPSVSSATTMIVMHEDAEKTLPEVVQKLGNPAEPQTLPDEVVIVVGPEGGISQQELAAMDEAGAYMVRVGEAVFRSSTAGTVAITLLNHLLNRW